MTDNTKSLSTWQGGYCPVNDFINFCYTPFPLSRGDIDTKSKTIEIKEATHDS